MKLLLSLHIICSPVSSLIFQVTIINIPVHTEQCTPITYTAQQGSKRGH